ncbi:carboxypeptidase-like regulatory domain-containing protein [uncultured Psychroserpens sp.]|uniref:carboxypeptidase-like regulatory domain-containing protein n=1 Tax=uncultured Psychroserpens sp. TaxID=255436 RepID=UPI00261DEBA5|nr:carboxypeptidase-like regulatory domain-containing protein [uncultured Psychroserpens sp.]
MKQFIFIFFLVTNAFYAQITPFEGKLLDYYNNEPVAFAHIKFKNSSTGVSTTNDGNFKLVIDNALLKSKVHISCLSYKDTLVNASELQNKIFHLQPKAEILDEVIVEKYESKEISFGSTKGKRTNRHLHRRDTIMIAQFINGNKIDSTYNYLKTVTLKFTNKIITPSQARIRIFDRNEVTGAPENDLLSESVIITITRNQKIYDIDFSEFVIEVPKDGFFVAIEKFIVPMNRCFIAPIERSTYPRYTAEFKKKTYSEDSEKSKLLSFEKYRNEVTLYAPVIYLTEKKAKHEDFGDLYSLNSNQWEMYKNTGNGFIIPMEIVLSN